MSSVNNKKVEKIELEEWMDFIKIVEDSLNEEEIETRNKLWDNLDSQLLTYCKICKKIVECDPIRKWKNTIYKCKTCKDTRTVRWTEKSLYGYFKIEN